VETVLQALAIFEDIAGMTADEAAALSQKTVTPEAPAPRST
jgi:hypothetical protein